MVLLWRRCHAFNDLKEVQLMSACDGRVAVMSADWISHPDTGVDEIAVLTVLALHADRDGLCWPSQALLARLLNRSRPWVNKVINRLCELGLLSKTRRHRDDGGNRSCLYRLKRPASATDHDQAPDRMATDRIDRPGLADDQAGPAGDSLGSPAHNRKNPSEPNCEDTLAVSATKSWQRSSPMEAEPTIVPEDWQPDVEDLRWAGQQFPGLDLKRHTARFVFRCRAKGYSYRHPGTAWRAWLLDDAQLLQEAKQPRPHHGCRPQQRHPGQASLPPSATYQRWQVWGQLATEGLGHVA